MANGWRLVAQLGLPAGQAFDLTTSVVTIGREAGNDIVVEGPQVSRYHARLTLQGGVYIVEDLGSTNGTFVNGQRVTRPTPIKIGDTLGVGEGIVLWVQGSAGETLVERGPSQPVPAMPPPPPAPVYAPPPPPVYASPPPAYVPPPYAYPVRRSSDNSCWFWGCGCLLLLACTLSCLGALAALTPLGAMLLALIPPGLITP